MNLDTEANLQGEFYHHAKLLNLTVILELTTPCGRLDIAVLNAAKTHLLAIIECKSSPGLFLNGQSAQIKRYKQIGAPVYGLSDLARAAALALTIKRHHGTSQGVALAHLKTLVFPRKTPQTLATRFSHLNIRIQP